MAACTPPIYSTAGSSQTSSLPQRTGQREVVLTVGNFQKQGRRICACIRSLEEPHAELKSPEASTPSFLHVPWLEFRLRLLISFLNACLCKSTVLCSFSLVRRFIYHQPWNNHTRFIFPERHSFKRLAAVLFGQLQSGISVTQHIASNCMCQREWSHKGNKSGSTNMGTAHV